MKKISSTIFACLVSVLMIAGVSAFAQEATTTATTTPPAPAVKALSSVAYPIPELGNCTDREACHAYCDQTANMQACSDYAKAHGFGSQSDAARTKTFVSKIKGGKAPGGCDSLTSCNAYCADVKNLNECVAFAEQNGFKGDNYNEGKKVQTFLRAGGSTPGNCQTNNECKQYCGQFSHAEECAAFAGKAGLTQGKSAEHASITAQIVKINALSQKGNTPGNCSSKDNCEKYCEDKTHQAECRDFASKVNAIGQEVRTPKPVGVFSSTTLSRPMPVKDQKERMMTPPEKKPTTTASTIEKQEITSVSPIAKRCYAEVTGNTATTTIGNAMMGGDVRDKFLQCLKANQQPVVREQKLPLPPRENQGIIPTMMRNVFSPDGGQSLNYFERFSAAAFAPIAWIFGK